MIKGLPEPALVSFLPDKTPHFIHCRFFHVVDLHEDLVWIHAVHCESVDVWKLRRFFLARQ